MAARRTSPPPVEIAAEAARALLLHGQGLLERRDRKPTRANLRRQIRKLGYVQLDSIPVVARAQDLTMRARFTDYRPEQLRRMVERDPCLFEHWVHDAAVIPVAFAPWWTARFRRHAETRRERMRRRSGSRAFGRLCREVRARIEREGPLPARAFEAPPDRQGTGWWDWKPAKVALEYLWLTGELVVCRRDAFQKVYDLTERFLPALAEAPRVTHRQYVDWACREALDRLGTATHRELAHYWHGMSADDARAWGERAIRDGRAVPARRLDLAGEGAQACLAHPDWERRADRAPAAPAGVRLLSPFDPVVRERERLRRLFDFDYRFEAFIPEAKRRDGYYVTPLWRGDRPVGRVDPKFDRATGTLRLRGLRFEPGCERDRRIRAETGDEIDALAAWLGAERIEWEGPSLSHP